MLLDDRPRGQNNLQSGNRLTRTKLLQFFFLMTSVGLIARSIHIQFGNSERISKLARRQFQSRVSAMPHRGFILDRNRNDLAISIRAKSLFVYPEVLRNSLKGAKNRRKMANLSSAISRILQIPHGALQQRLKTQKGFIWLKRHLTDAEEQTLTRLDLDSIADAKGRVAFGLVEESKRFYPMKNLASHVLGAVNIDGKGIEGLELTYEHILGGETVNVPALKDARGRAIFQDEKALSSFRDGKSIQLTIDRTLQFEVERILINYTDNLRARAGMVVVMDVATGGILALANTPNFDPNHTNKSSMEARRNRTITDLFEPGSVMKPFITGLALDRGMSPKSRIYCEDGKFQIEDRIITEAETHEKWKWLTLSEIVMHSSNIGAAKLGLSIGALPISEFINNIGFGARTGIELPGETQSPLATKEKLFTALKSRVRLANVAFGQGISTSAIHIASLYNAIANRGEWIQPHLVTHVLKTDNQLTEHEFQNFSRKQIFTPETSEKLLAILETVVGPDGTGKSAVPEGWRVAGKTGTAQKIDPTTKRYSKSKYVCSFAGMAPLPRPQVTILVIFDEPATKHYAAETAAPAFREIAAVALQRLGVPPLAASQGLAQNQDGKLKSGMQSAINKVLVQSNRGGQNVMPNLVGLTLKQATQLISTLPIEDVKIDSHGANATGIGRITDQQPPAYESLENVTKLKLTLGPY